MSVPTADPALRPEPRRRRLPAALVALALLAGVGWLADVGWHAVFPSTKHAVTSRCDIVGPIETYAESPEQLLNASIIADVAMQRGLPQRAVVIALATAQQESKLVNLPGGDLDSVGLFQQRTTQGWGTKQQIMQPTYAAGKFYDALVKVPNWQQLPVTEAASDVQRNAYPGAYASWEPRATALAGALTGTTSGTLTCRLANPGVAVTAATDPAASGASSTSAGPAALLAAATATTTNGLRDDLAIEHPAVSTVDARTTSVTVTGLLPDATGDDTTARHRTRTVASWAIAHAATDGIVTVDIGDQEWRAARGTWQQLKTPVAPDAVVMTIGAAGG
jgi:hypothetical protein